MAYYSKENFAEQSVTIENGSTIVLRDDGKGFDRIAGDGIYTAKIQADVKGFREQATTLLRKMKEVDYKPFRYVNRQRIMDPDVSESFDMEAFENNDPVSVSALSVSATSDLTQREITLAAIRANSVLITNLNVVEDPTRTWGFCTQTGNLKTKPGPSIH